MKYNPPVGATDPDLSYLNADPAHDGEGSPVPAEAIEQPMREIVAVIEAAGLIPSNADLTQLSKAISILRGGKAVFTVNGEFIVPAGVSKIFISGCGGGGGGGAGAGQSASYIWSGGGGGAGQSTVKTQFTVSPGQRIAITIGGPGVAGAGASGAGASGGNGGSGGNTTVGTLLILQGGGGGQGGHNLGPGASGVGYPSGGSGTGGASPAVTGTSYMIWPSGSGGSSAFGGGGLAVGGSYGQTPGLPGHGYGSGGSGSPGVTGSAVGSRPGGAGAPGIVIIEW